jgi:O-antigen/teichoic acid export membrane protein
MSTPKYSLLKEKRPGIITRIIHGSVAGGVSYILNIASNLLLLPLYLRFWPVALYGEWMALYSVVNYLGSLDFGVTTAAINAATIAYASNDWQAFKRVQGTAWATSLVIAGFGGIVIAALSLFYFHIDLWLNLTVLGHHNAQLVFFCLAISLLASIPGNQLIAVYIATGNFTKYQWLYNAYMLFTLIVTAAALSVGAGPVLLAVVTAGTTLSTIVISLLLLCRHGSRLYPRLQDAEWRTARVLAAPTGQIGISMIASALSVQGPIVVLSRMLGGPAVALFTTTRTVANVVRGTAILLRAPLRPELGAASAQTCKDALRRIFRLAIGVDTITTISLSAVLWSAGTWFIQVWSHGRIHPDAMLLHLFLIAVVLEGFQLTLVSAGWATNHIGVVSLGQLAAAILSIIFAVAFISRFGPSAVPIGIIASLIVIMMPIALQNASAEAYLPLRFVILRLLVPFSFLIVFSATFSTWIANHHFAYFWLSALFSSLIICTLAVVVTGALFLTRDDRQVVHSRLVGRIRGLYVSARNST